jgi:iron(III) transport system permease protein
MMIPSIASIALLTWIERYNIRYDSLTDITPRKNTARDTVWSILSAMISLFVISIFAAIIVVPFVQSWPYELTPSFDHFAEVFADDELVQTYRNSIFVAFMTALFGTLIVYGAGLVASRSTLSPGLRRSLDSAALVINTIPGMVLGIAYMLAFSGTSLQNTFTLIIVCTIIHYFSTPFLMMKGSLEKMDSSWETTGRLMGDNWIKTVLRIITPNAASTLAEIFRYYFVNAMVTVSAVIFIVGSDTMVLTTKIKELEHYQQFDDIFVLSILILVTNLVVTAAIKLFTARRAAPRRSRVKPLRIKSMRKATA